MKKTVIAAAAALVPGAALAHPGHFGELAGHTHWIALGALSLAGVITVVALARKLGRNEKTRREDSKGRS